MREGPENSMVSRQVEHFPPGSNGRTEGRVGVHQAQAGQRQLVAGGAGGLSGLKVSRRGCGRGAGKGSGASLLTDAPLATPVAGATPRKASHEHRGSGGRVLATLAAPPALCVF